LLLSSAILNIEDKVIYYNVDPLETLYKALPTYKEAQLDNKYYSENEGNKFIFKPETQPPLIDNNSSIDNEYYSTINKKLYILNIIR
jgi:hypothetical protein